MDPCLKLPLEFYLRADVVQISRDLLGCFLFTKINGKMTDGKIVETEAYRGAEDRACHAYDNRRTQRTEVMFHEGGITYVYLCHGMHSMLNVVTKVPENEGKKPKTQVNKHLANSPGKVAQALGIDRKLNGASLSSQTICIEKGNPPKTILASPQIGVEYAGGDAKLPWRFVCDN